MPLAKKCEVIRDEIGWWLRDGKRTTLMDAENEIEAQHEAMQEGFNQITIIPKTPFP